MGPRGRHIRRIIWQNVPGAAWLWFKIFKAKAKYPEDFIIAKRIE